MEIKGNKLKKIDRRYFTPKLQTNKVKLKSSLGHAGAEFFWWYSTKVSNFFKIELCWGSFRILRCCSDPDALYTTAKLSKCTFWMRCGTWDPRWSRIWSCWNDSAALVWTWRPRTLTSKSHLSKEGSRRITKWSPSWTLKTMTSSLPASSRNSSQSVHVSTASSVAVATRWSSDKASETWPVCGSSETEVRPRRPCCRLEGRPTESRIQPVLRPPTLLWWQASTSLRSRFDTRS